MNYEVTLESREFIEWSEMSLLPTVEFDRYLTLKFPLWLLAFLCLAWPVTSFLLSRRRRGRGFAVEPLSPPLAPGEVDAERSGADGEGGQQLAPERHGGINL
jgi:hypothetical protein